MTRSKLNAGGGKDRVLKEATRLFVSKGYAATSMAQVAEAAEMQKASLYHHFKSKEALFIACVSNGYEGVIAKLTAARDTPGISHEKKLRTALGAVHDHVVSSPVGAMSPTIAETSRAIPAVARSFWDLHISAMHEITGKIIDDGVTEGAFRRLDPTVLELFVFGPIVYVSLSNQMFGRFDDLASHFDPEKTKAKHIDEVCKLLQVSGP